MIFKLKTQEIYLSTEELILDYLLLQVFLGLFLQDVLYMQME